jgi:hypothetical protein
MTLLGRQVPILAAAFCERQRCPFEPWPAQAGETQCCNSDLMGAEASYEEPGVRAFLDVGRQLGGRHR